MSQREDVNLTLILEIEKYEYLYNYTMPEYSRKEQTEKAWVEIAKKVGLTVNEAKEKWRNIRSAFLRSLKSSGGRMKRPYYLYDELRFLLPFMKLHSLSQPNFTLDASDTQNLSENEDNDIDENNFDPLLVPSAVNHPKKVRSSPANETPGTSYSQDNNIDQSRRNRRKRLKTEVELRILDYLASKKQKASTESSCQATISSVQHFFLSLTPDVESMTENQIRRFKIEVLLLIEKIKNEENT